MGLSDRDYLRVRDPSDGEARLEGPASKPTFSLNWRTVVAIVLLLAFLAGSVLSAF